jgi:transposase
VTLFSDVLKGCDKEYERGRKQGKRKGGIKSHAMLKVSEGVPCLVRLSAAAVADGNYMKEIKNLERGSMVAIDRAYCHHGVFEELSEKGIFYTTRLKDIVKYEVMETFSCKGKPEGILRDERALLSIPKKAKLKNKKHEARVFISHSAASQIYIESVPNRFVLHFIPTHSSWLNLVERWFAEITNKRIRKGSFESVSQLIQAIKDYIKYWNKSGRVFKWTKKPSDILAKIKKAKAL